MKQFRNALIPTAATAFIMVSCDKDPDEDAKKTNNDLLLGEWELVKVDGEVYGEPEGNYIERLVFEFKIEGDFEYCYIYEDITNPSNTEEYCEAGTWSWTNTSQTELSIESIEFTGDLKITSITEDKLIGDFSGGEGAYAYVSEVEFEKID